MRAIFYTLPFLGALACLGCDAVKIPDVVNKQVQQVNQQVQQSVEGVKNQVLPAGIELTTTPPIKASTCYGQWTPPNINRTGILTLASYRDPASETYPSIFARVQAPLATLDQLQGQTVEAEIFVRRSAEGPVLHSPRSEPVKLKIESVQGKTVVAQVVKGSLVDVETGDSVPFLGKLTAEVE